MNVVIENYYPAALIARLEKIHGNFFAVIKVREKLDFIANIVFGLSFALTVMLVFFVPLWGYTSGALRSIMELRNIAVLLSLVFLLAIVSSLPMVMSFRYRDRLDKKLKELGISKADALVEKLEHLMHLLEGELDRETLSVGSLVALADKILCRIRDEIKTAEEENPLALTDDMKREFKKAFETFSFLGLIQGTPDRYFK